MDIADIPVAFGAKMMLYQRPCDIIIFTSCKQFKCKVVQTSEKTK